MPCYDSRDSPDYVKKETRKEQQEYVDKLTRLLCRACYLVDEIAGGIPDEGNDAELVAWYTEHREVDRKRRK